VSQASEPALTITVDGPAGSGKSTLGWLLAQRLGYLYFDSGALYRALTLAAVRRGLPLDDGPALAALVPQLAIRLEPPTVPDGRQYTLYLDGEDVTWALRSPEVDAGVSQVSAHPQVRKALLPLQQSVARAKRVVMVGRDMGTVVCPEAEVKVFLVADLATRAARRQRDLAAQSKELPLEAVQANLAERDRLDSSRTSAPLRQPPDAMVLDSSKLTPEEEVEAVLARVCSFYLQ
jgi:cytidylate kinase